MQLKMLKIYITASSLFLMAGLSITSCSELRSEFDPHTWRYQPYPRSDMPPSWENDMGRPGPEDSGDDMFDDTW
jgi:hypothetical protein